MTTNELNTKADFNPAKHHYDAGFRNPESSRATENSDAVFLSMAQVAKMTGYHQDYLGQMARSGKLDAIKVGRNWQTTKLAVDIMLGRVPKEEPQQVVPVVVQPVVQAPVQPVVKIEALRVETPKISSPIKIVNQVTQPLPQVSKPIAINISKPQPVAQPMVQPVKIFTPIPQPKVEAKPEPIMASRNSIAKKVNVKHFATSADAGPNLQELIATYAHQEVVSLKDVGPENREKLLRWNKMAPKFSNSRNNFASNRFTEFTKQYPEKEEPMIEVRSSPFWRYATAGVASIMLLAAGYLGSTYLNNSPQESLLTTEASPDRMVAGESTSVAEPVTGKAIITAETSDQIVKDPSVKADSSILVTFKADYPGRYWVTDQKDGEFTLKLSEPVIDDTAFDYMIMAADEENAP